MTKLLAIAVLVSATAAPGMASACNRLTPYYAALNEYTSVFVGRVTAIRLAGYENHLMGKPDAVVFNVGEIKITDGSEPAFVRAVVTRRLRGDASGALELQLAGCTFEPPALKSEVLFFILRNGGAIVVSREESEREFQTWLEKLGAPRE